MIFASFTIFKQLKKKSILYNNTILCYASFRNLDSLANQDIRTLILCNLLSSFPWTIERGMRCRRWSKFSQKMTRSGGFLSLIKLRSVIQRSRLHQNRQVQSFFSKLDTVTPLVRFFNLFNLAKLQWNSACILAKCSRAHCKQHFEK